MKKHRMRKNNTRNGRIPPMQLHAGNFLYNSGSCEGVLLNENKLYSKCWIFLGIDGIGSSLQGWDEGWTCLSASLDKNQSVWKRSQLSWDEYWEIWYMKVLMKCRNTHTHTHTHTHTLQHSVPVTSFHFLSPCISSHLFCLTNKDKHTLQGCLPTETEYWTLSFSISSSHTHTQTHTHTLRGPSPLGNLWLNSPPALSLSLTPLPWPYNDLPHCARQTHARTHTHRHTHSCLSKFPH